MGRSRSPAWVVDRGHRLTVTWPPVTAPAARNGAALERSGSIATSTARTGPGRTTQRSGSSSSTVTPCSRRAATVMSMWGREGTGPPRCRTSTPWSYLAPASSSAETNWLEADASMTTLPPGTRPFPSTVNGSARRSPSSMAMPRPRRPSSTAPIGRVRACGSPSKVTGPSASAATAGTNRMTVPARPQSTTAGPRSGPGVTVQSLPVLSTATPRLRSAPAMRSVSRERSAPRTTEAPSETAASSNARLVSDLEPGSVTEDRTGPEGVGAGHRSAVASIAASLPRAGPGALLSRAARRSGRGTEGGSSWCCPSAPGRPHRAARRGPSRSPGAAPRAARAGRRRTRRCTSRRWSCR